MTDQQLIDKIMSDLSRYKDGKYLFVLEARMKEILEKHLSNEEKWVEIKANRYECIDDKPKRVRYDEKWTEHIDDYVHQDNCYANICTQPNWCRCSE